MSHGSETSLSRIEEISPKQMSSLYSLFDPMKHNVMRFVEIISALTVLDKPEKLPQDKLKVYGKFTMNLDMIEMYLISYWRSSVVAQVPSRMLRFWRSSFVKSLE